MQSTYVYTDLETIGSDDPEVIAEIAAGITAPGNYKKPESIAEWEAQNKPALVQEALKRTSFDGGLGRIICIGFAVNDAVPLTFVGEEKDILVSFYSALGQIEENSPKVLVGHNLIGFDLRFLYQRSVVNGIRPPAYINFNARSWDKTVNDTMLMWNPDRDKRVSLDRLCRILGVPSPKTEMDGSKVWEYYKEGRIEEIRSYCAGDIVSTRMCHRKMMFL